MFCAEIRKKYRNFIWKFSVFGGEIFYIFEKASFRNDVLGLYNLGTIKQIFRSFPCEI